MYQGDPDPSRPSARPQLTDTDMDGGAWKAVVAVLAVIVVILLGAYAFSGQREAAHTTAQNNPVTKTIPAPVPPAPKSPGPQ